MSTSQEKKLMELIAKKLGKEGIEYIKKHKELPSIKLTREEIEFLKGGRGGPTVFYDTEFLNKLTKLLNS